MGSDLIVGLRLSAIGLTVTFAALGILIILMLVLLRVFPAKKVVRTEPGDTGSMKSEEQQLEEMAVALAVGISLLENDGALVQRDPNLGRLLE
jgi:Na+-transporting methylmalonyl-CoA/oxaloacetate decarboxylase gamma subunit